MKEPPSSIAMSCYTFRIQSVSWKYSLDEEYLEKFYEEKSLKYSLLLAVLRLDPTFPNSRNLHKLKILTLLIFNTQIILGVQSNSIALITRWSHCPVLWIIWKNRCGATFTRAFQRDQHLPVVLTIPAKLDIYILRIFRSEAPL